MRDGNKPPEDALCAAEVYDSHVVLPYRCNAKAKGHCEVCGVPVCGRHKKHDFRHPEPTK